MKQLLIHSIANIGLLSILSWSVAIITLLCTQNWTASRSEAILIWLPVLSLLIVLAMELRSTAMIAGH